MTEYERIDVDSNFPSVEEIKAAVEECVARECNGCWPEEHWFDIGESWSVNIYVYDGKKHIAVYPNYLNDDDYRETNCDVGIILQ